jgi:arylsulfatase
MRSGKLLFNAILALVSAISFLSHAQAAEGRPNILLVMADDMGWTDIGAFGSEIDTPNLDALAAEGVKFTDFHVSISCSPTRSMLMSGTDNHLAGLGTMGEMIAPEQAGKPGYEGHLNDRVVSLAELLQDNGYHTYMAGKWHLGHEHQQFPHARGFDRSFSMLLGGASYWSDMFGMLAEMEPTAEYVMGEERLETLPAEFYATRSYADFLVDSIRENRGDGKPFFAYLAFTAPHDPLHVPEPWLSKYRGQYDDGYEALRAKRISAAKEIGVFPGSAETSDRHPMTKAWDSLSEEEKALEARGMEVYAGMVENMDFHFGRVVKFLQDIDEYDNTIVIFLSDNGPNPWYSEDYPGNLGSEWFAQFDNSVDNIGHPMSHHAYGMGWSSASSGPLDRFKMTVAEGGTRSPLLIDGPGVNGGRQVDAFAYVWDIMPTILDMVGIEHPKEFAGQEIEPLMGRPLSEILSGSKPEVYEADEYISGEMLNGKWTRKGDFKAMSIAPPYGPGTWQLYNLAEDPGETRDLAQEMPELLKELQEAWDQYASEVGVVLTKN